MKLQLTREWNDDRLDRIAEQVHKRDAKAGIIAYLKTNNTLRECFHKTLVKDQAQNILAEIGKHEKTHVVRVTWTAFDGLVRRTMVIHPGFYELSELIQIYKA